MQRKQINSCIQLCLCFISTKSVVFIYVKNITKDNDICIELRYIIVIGIKGEELGFIEELWYWTETKTLSPVLIVMKIVLGLIILLLSLLVLFHFLSSKIFTGSRIWFLLIFSRPIYIKSLPYSIDVPEEIQIIASIRYAGREKHYPRSGSLLIIFKSVQKLKQQDWAFITVFARFMKKLTIVKRSCSSFEHFILMDSKFGDYVDADIYIW